MKKISLLLIMVLVVSLFAGCGSSDEESSGQEATTTETKTDETETGSTTEEKADTTEEKPMASGEPLQMLWWNDGIEGEVMQGIIDSFTAETGIEIELVVLAYDDYSAKLKTMIRGGEAPALMRATEGHIAEFKEFLLPLDDAYNKADYTNVYFNGNGETIVLPMDVTANGLFVNLDLLDANGVNYPGLGQTWTWAEFESEMGKLMGADGVAFPGVFDNKAHRFFPMVYQFGGKIWNTPYTDSALTDQAAVDALTTLQRMNTNGMLDPAVWAGAAKPNELFQTGQYGFHMSGNWFVAAYQELGFNWGVVPMPTGDGSTQATILGGKGLCAVSESGQEEEALQFIEYMAKGENHDKFTGGVPFLSPRLAATPDYGDFQAAYEVFQAEIANTPAAAVADWQAQVEISGMYPIINQAVEACMGGDDPLETLERLEKDLMDKAAELGL